MISKIVAVYLTKSTELENYSKKAYQRDSEMIVFVLILVLNTTQLKHFLGIGTIRTYVSDFEGLTIKLFLESPELL